MLAVVTILIFGNLKDCLLKILQLLLQVITNSTQNYVLFGTKTKVEFNGSFLKQDKITYNNRKVINIYLVYEISRNISISDYPTLENCLFGGVSLTKRADINKYKYSGSRIGFDSGGTGRNVIIFGLDMNLSTKIDNRKIYILVLGKGPTQGLEHTLSAEKILQSIIKIFV